MVFIGVLIGVGISSNMPTKTIELEKSGCRGTIELEKSGIKYRKVCIMFNTYMYEFRDPDFNGNLIFSNGNAIVWVPIPKEVK